jgi:hypothetical protein
MNKRLLLSSGAWAGLGRVACSDLISAETFIREMSRPASVTYCDHETLAKMKTRLGAWAKPDEPFKDDNGKWYVRDKKGTIRRCSNPNIT